MDTVQTEAMGLTTAFRLFKVLHALNAGNSAPEDMSLISGGDFSFF